MAPMRVARLWRLRGATRGERQVLNPVEGSNNGGADDRTDNNAA